MQEDKVSFQKLNNLLKLGKLISQERDLDSLLHIFNDFNRDIVEADRCSIFLYDPKNNELETVVAHGINEKIRIPVDKGVAGYTFCTKEQQIVVDAYNDFRFYKSVDAQTKYLTKTILAVPVFNSKNQAVGVIQAINKRQGLFDHLDAECFILIAEYIGSCLEQAYLYKKLEDTQIKLIHKLSRAAEFKDDETSEHTKRVGYYSQICGSAYGLCTHDAQILMQVAPMHDAGKIGIPDHIIKKKGKLTTQEFELIKTHTTIGYKLLMDEDNEILQKAALIAREHHEKWDGSGYPEGLKKEQISVFGRIVAIADVFDALTSKRPYKQPWSMEQARMYLIEKQGSQFDPELVKVFLSCFEQIKAIRILYQDKE